MTPDAGRSSRAFRIFVFLLILAGAAATFYFFFTISLITIPILVGIVMSYLLEPPVAFLERRGVPRTLGILASFVALSIPIAYLSIFLPGWIAQEYRQLIEIRSPQAIENIQGLLADARVYLIAHSELFREGGRFDLSDLDIATFIVNNSLRVLQKLVKAAPSLVVSYVLILLLTPVVTFYILRDGRSMKAAFIRIVPNSHFEMSLSVLSKIDQQLGAYIRGRILEGAIIGSIAYMGLRIGGIEHAGFMAVAVGTTNLMPYVGPWIGTIFAMLVGLIEYSTLAPIGTIFGVCVIAQLLDNVLVGPLVISKAVDLHPVAVLVACIAGAKVLSLLGLIIAVPVVCIVKVIVQEFFAGLRSYRVA